MTNFISDELEVLLMNLLKIFLIKNNLKLIIMVTDLIIAKQFKIYASY